MESAPPEHFIKPEPFPSASTPAAWTTTEHHPLSPASSSAVDEDLILRPDSALSLYPEAYFAQDDDGGDDDSDGEQQEAFNRISGILSNLLEEANNAIQHGVENEKPSDADAFDEKADDTIISPPSPPPSKRGSRSMQPSRLPRPIYIQTRRGSNLSLASSSLSSCSSPPPPDLFSPASSRATSPTLSVGSAPLSPKQPTTSTVVVKQRAARPLSCPMLMARRLSGEGATRQQQQQQQQRMRRGSAAVLRDPLVESYKRLDSSMALVESLSRDLATKERQHAKRNQISTTPASALRLSALLILPFLHIPHALISMVFDSMSTDEPNNLTGMIAWGIFFALANVMVDRVIRLPSQLPPADAVKNNDPNPTTSTTTTATCPADKLPPQQQQQHTMYIFKRRSRVVRRPSVYRKQPHSSALARSRTQPVHPTQPPQQQQQPTLFSTSRMMIKRRYSF